MKNISVFIIASFVTIFCNAQKVALKFNLEKGKEYKQHSVASTTISQEVMGMKMNYVMSMEGSVSYFIKSIDDNIYNMEVKYEKMKMKMKMEDDGGKQNPMLENAMAQTFKALDSMTNKLFSIRMDKSGKIIDVQGFDKILEGVIEQMEEVPLGKRAEIKTQVENSFGADAIKKSFETMLAIFPDGSITKGEKWTKAREMTGVGDLSIKVVTEYELIDITPTYVLIKGNAKMESDKAAGFVEKNAAFVKSEISGTMLSDIKVDKITGWVIESKVIQNMEGTVEVKETEDQEEGFKVPMKIKGETVITN